MHIVKFSLVEKILRCRNERRLTRLLISKSKHYLPPMIKKFFICLFGLYLCGCATVYNPATERKEVILIDDRTEVSLGRNVSQQLTSEQPLSRDPFLRERVEMVGRKISAVSDRQEILYEFSVLKDKELNALSLPGGFVYINSGLAEKINDDELAFVLGHEAGHVAAKHAVKKIQANMAFGLILNVAMASAGSENSQMAGSAANASGQIYNLVSLGYSREDEHLADKLGAKYAYKAGYSPYAAISALEKIKQNEGRGPKVLEYLRSHPYIDDRIKTLKQEIPAMISRLSGQAIVVETSQKSGYNKP